MNDLLWHDVMAEDELPQGDVWPVEVQGRDIAIYGVDGQPYASDNLCTHGNARLCEGFLEGHEIECPLHQGRFDVRTGQPSCAPVTEPIKTYPVKLEGGRLWLALG